MENRLDRAFASLRERGEGALIPLAPGDRAPYKASMEIVDMFAEAKADAVELAIPTRYPWMEGTAMQIHQLEALEQRIRPTDSFGLMQAVREKYPDLPLIAINFMGPVFTIGQTNYIEGCAQASIDAVDVPDYPLARSGDVTNFGAELEAEGIYFVVDVTTDEAVAAEGTRECELLRRTVWLSGGFLFMIAQPGGVSGTKDALPVEQLEPAVARVRRIEDEMNINTPIIAVCGISTPEQVRSAIFDVGADGVMLGSAISKRLQAGESLDRIQPFVVELKDATR